MAVDKAMSDYVDKAVAKKVEEKWQGEDVKKMIAGEVKACTEKVIEGLSNEIVKMGRQVENTERGLRQFEFVCFAKRGEFFSMAGLLPHLCHPLIPLLQDHSSPGRWCRSSSRQSSAKKLSDVSTLSTTPPSESFPRCLAVPPRWCSRSRS
jgi:hypothetical protein